jgi:hypothetical protein
MPSLLVRKRDVNEQHEDGAVIDEPDRIADRLQLTLKDTNVTANSRAFPCRTSVK